MARDSSSAVWLYSLRAFAACVTRVLQREGKPACLPEAHLRLRECDGSCQLSRPRDGGGSGGHDVLAFAVQLLELRLRSI